jgi:hypothetical protein
VAIPKPIPVVPVSMVPIQLETHPKALLLNLVFTVVPWTAIITMTAAVQLIL